MPEWTDEQVREATDCLLWRILSDGRLMCLVRQAFNWRITLGPDLLFVDDAY